MLPGPRKEITIPPLFFPFLHRKNKIWPLEEDGLSGILWNISQNLSLFAFYGRERQIVFYPNCRLWFTFLFSCEGITSFSKASRLFFCSLSVMETKSGSRTYHVIASLLMKLALRAAAGFCGHLTARHNTFFPPCSLIGKLTPWVDFYREELKIFNFFLPEEHSPVIHQSLSVCLSSCVNLRRRYSRRREHNINPARELFNLMSEEAGMVANANANVMKNRQSLTTDPNQVNRVTDLVWAAPTLNYNA